MQKEIVQVVISKERYDELINKETIADNNTFTLNMNHAAFLDIDHKSPLYPTAMISRGLQHINTFTKEDATIVVNKIMDIVHKR